MSEIPADLKYTNEHEWLKEVSDGTAIIGITDYAQSSLGDVTFVELPEPGDRFSTGDVFGVVESVKAASDLYMPLDGEVIEVNTSLADAPERVNQSPYGEAWLVKVRMENPGDGSNLLSAEEYSKITG